MSAPSEPDGNAPADGAASGGEPPKRPKTQRERDADKRREKLQAVEDQVRDGSLTIREMTPEERERWAPRSDPPPPRRRGR